MVSRLDDYEDDYEDETPEYKSDYDKLDEKIKAVSKYARAIGADLGACYHCCIRRHAVLLICVTAGMLIMGVSFGIAISTLYTTVGELKQKVEALEKQK